MRITQPIVLCLVVAGCAATTEPQPQTVAVNCRSTEAQTGSHIVRKDNCPVAMSEEERQRRLDQIEQEQQRMNLPRPGAGSR